MIRGTSLFEPQHAETNFWEPIKEDTLHPTLKRQDRLGKEPFAGFGTVVEDITESEYTKNQPILLGFFWENAFFVFLHYKIKQKTGQNRAKIPLNLASEGLKYAPEVQI